MAIVVGTDTYISLADANTYVSDNYPTTVTEYTSWDALSDANKELYLKRAQRKIDRQFLRGVKAVSTQTLEFPRAIRLDYTNISQYPETTVRQDDNWVVETSVANNVKYAQVEEALYEIINSATANKRLQLQAQGVKSFRLGNLSETFKDGATGSSEQLRSLEARDLLRYYMVGGVPIV